MFIRTLLLCTEPLHSGCPSITTTDENVEAVEYVECMINKSVCPVADKLDMPKNHSP